MTDRVLSDRYRIVRHLARGGMAEVYLGHDQLLDRPVAVKVLLPELARDASFVERFRREAKSAAGLNHPNIVSVYDFGEDDAASFGDAASYNNTAYFIVMEYVAGETLRDIIHRDGPMEPSRAVEIAADIAAALAAAHQQGIIHRDVKPANVLMSVGTIKVTDFGIARASDVHEGLTMPGSVIGTATYLSPEQAQGLPVDQRSDLYSLGMVLYEMLAGTPPFKGDSPVSVAYKQVNETPPPPSTHNPAVTPRLDALVAKAMAKDPAHRPGSADDLRAELLAAGQAPANTPTIAFGVGANAAMAAGAHDATEMMVATPSARGGQPAMAAAGPSAGGGQPAMAAAQSPSATPPAVFRRRRMVVLGLLLLLLVGGVAVVAALGTGGASTTATVPPVEGLRVADAVAAVTQAHLKSQLVGAEPGAPDLVVTQQNPRGGAKVDRSTTVSLVVAAPTSTTVRRTIPPTTRAATTTTRPVTTTERSSTTVPPTTSATGTTVVATTAPPTT